MDERRKGDINQKYKIIAECCKRIGNSSFGRTVMDKSKHKNVKYANEVKLINIKINGCSMTLISLMMYMRLF